MKTLLIHTTEEDLKMSGPHVWPKITAETAYDRFIHRRPELIYLQARRKMIEQRKTAGADPEPAMIGIRITRWIRQDGKRKTKDLQRFTHIFEDDDLEDVRTFLRMLRHMLARCMPDKPLLNCSLMVKFYDVQQKQRALTSTMEKWL